MIRIKNPQYLASTSGRCRRAGANFLKENRSLIKDRKIFVENDTNGLF
jgi:hypothetical protein